MSNKILILFAHPLYEKSSANKALVKHIPNSENITFHDLYEKYPEFDIDVKKEQQLLNLHDIVIWHHPMYWYSCPPLLKQWIDMVLEYGWAYGKFGLALQDKLIFQTITTGGSQENYCATGRENHTVLELLEPFKQTSKVCKMEYLPPFVVHGTHKMDEVKYEESGILYGKLLQYLENTELNLRQIREFNYLNDWIKTVENNGK